MTDDELIEKLNGPHEWGYRCVDEGTFIQDDTPLEACALIQDLSDKLDRAMELLIAEREESLWNAYNSGHVKNGRWTHMFMSDGEWLAQSCGFNPREADYLDADIRAAIPPTARSTTLKELTDG